MKKLQFAGSSRATQGLRHACAFAAMLSAFGAAHAAPVGIQVWHQLDGANKAEFEKLAKDFNRSQKEVEVVLRAFPSAQALQQEAAAAVKTKQAPNLVQLDDDHSPEVVAAHAAVLPLYQLMAKHPIKESDWFLPSTTSFTRDSRGRLLAFPWMAEIPVMYYNTEYYKKAGLDPNRPAGTWAELQEQLLKLRDTANIDCPYASSDQVAVHLENLAPVNNQAFLTNDNGLGKAKAVPATKFDTLYMRHLSLMVSWKRSLLFTAHSADRGSDALFAKGECAVLTTGSGSMGQFLNTRKLSFGVAPLPYYDQATKAAGKPFVGGSALWALAGHAAEQDKATAQFLSWLSTPVVAAAWHQRTGYLPLTEGAFRASDVSFYSRVPGAQQVVAAMRGEAGSNNRGFRIANYDSIQTAFNAQLDAALSGQTPPVAALNAAAAQAKALVQKK